MRKSDKTLMSDLMLAPLVAAIRLPLMAAEASKNPFGVETVKAVTEKSAAVAEGIFAAQMSLVGSMMSFWSDAAKGGVAANFVQTAAENSMRAALLPASKAVRANYRRLSKRRPT